MTEQLEDMQVMLVDEHGNELTVVESLSVPDNPTNGFSMIQLEYKTIKGEPVFCDNGDFIYRDRHYTLKREV